LTTGRLSRPSMWGVPLSADLELGDFQVRPAERRAFLHGRPLALGARAFDLVLVLIEQRDRVVSKDELLALVWPAVVVEEANLAVQVSGLRKLLGNNAITTIPGRGYQWTGGPPQAAPGAAPEPVTRPSAAPVHGELIGRDAEFTTLQQALGQRQAGAVVSLVGPAGIGKTSLARALAASMRDFATRGVAPLPPGAVLGQVCEVELAALPPQRVHDAAACDTAALASAVAVALGASTAAAMGPLRSLQHHLRYRTEQHALPHLLVLDNCEHVLAAAQALCVALLEAAPMLPLLVTSQTPLNLPGEHVLRLDALAVPAEDDMAQAAASPAVALFCARAALAQRHFALCAENAAAVAEICRRLDGIPLALELAAGRLPLLGIEGLRAGLDQRFGLLRKPGSHAPLRHQTLLAALDWSHELLPSAERVLLRRLSVFSGGFTAVAAQQLAGGPDVDVWGVLDALGSLVDKSLVTPSPSAMGRASQVDGLQEPRFLLLETVRAYARAKLESSGEALEIERRHAEQYLALAEAHGGGLLGGEQAAGRRRIVAPELDNLRAAMLWFLQHDLTHGLRLGAALVRVWRERGLLVEGSTTLATLLARTPAEPADPTRLAVLVGLGAMALEQDDATLQKSMGEQVLWASRSLGDTLRESHGHGMLAHAALIGNDTAMARQHFGDVLRLFQQLGDVRGEAETRSNLAFCWLADGDLAQALALLQQALPQARASAHRWTEAAVLQGLGDVSLAMGNLVAAQGHLTESLLLRRGIGHVYQVVASLLSLALVQLCQGQLDAARCSLLEATQACKRHGFGRLDALCFVGAGVVAAQHGQGEAAVRLLATAQLRLQGTPLGRRPNVAQVFDAGCARSRALLGDAAWRSGWAHGHALEHKEAMGLALTVLGEPASKRPLDEAARDRVA
jgi:predicted ATPase/DNA-binding winged helix-turn-helix (wHTH) protein